MSTPARKVRSARWGLEYMKWGRRADPTRSRALATLPQSVAECHCARSQRLMRDFKRLRNDPPQGVNGSPNPDNIMLWNAVIFGPDDTPWDGGVLGITDCRAGMLPAAAESYHSC
jgi:hypothetical protein